MNLMNIQMRKNGSQHAWRIIVFKTILSNGSNSYPSIICLFYKSFTGYISDLQNDKTNRITWCTLNIQEQSKCLNLSAAVNRDKQKFNPRDFMELVCKPVNI